MKEGDGGRTEAQGFEVEDGLRQRFTGYERDDETGLNYAQARYYASMQGRFISADPIFFQAEMLTDPQRFNLYSYTRNNPLRYVDIDGQILKLSGNLVFLQGMIEFWAGALKDKISVAADGTVSFDVTAEDLKGNEGAQFLYDLVQNQETILFYAGADATAAGSLVAENKTSKSFSRERLMKQFTGEAYASGGGQFVATRDRVSDKGDASSGIPGNGVFAVIAFNTDASMFEIIGQNDTDSNRGEKDPADLPVAPSAFFIHEGAESLDFVRQKKEGKALNSVAYQIAHGAAILRENKIREQVIIAGGKAGGAIRVNAPGNKKN